MKLRSLVYGALGFVVLVIVANTLVIPLVIRNAIGQARTSLPHIYGPQVDLASVPSQYLGESARKQLVDQQREHGRVQEFRVVNSFAQISGLPAVLELEVRRETRFHEVLYFNYGKCDGVEFRRE